MELKINDRFENRTVKHFNDVRVQLSHNTIGGTFSLQYHFDPNNIEQKELSCVSHFHEVQLIHLGKLILTGVITNNRFTQGTQSNLVTISGYSLPGVLESCQIPPSIYPIQSDGLSIAQIARKLTNPFGLKVKIDSSVSSRMNQVLPTTESTITQTIKDYLSEICKQKNIIMSHTEKGELLFTESNVNGTPVFEFDLRQESQRLIEANFEYNGAGMNRDITVMKEQSLDGGNAGQSTIRNPYVINTYYKPKVMSQTSGTDNNTSEAARRELGNQLKGVTLSLRLKGWDIDGKLVLPNNTIRIIAPKLYIFNKETFFIESVVYETDSGNAPVMTLNCVLPDVYTNKLPVTNIFRGINLHPL